MTEDQKLAEWVLEDAEKASSLPDQPDRPGYRAYQIDCKNQQAVERFGNRMATRLAAAREDGRHGWHDPEQRSIADLRRMFDDQCLRAHPDFVDVANFAMMLFFRTRGMPGCDSTIPPPKPLTE